jgi:hypothetical protein
MLQQALMILEVKEIDKLKDKVVKLGTQVKQNGDPASKKQLAASIKSLQRKISGLESALSEGTQDAPSVISIINSLSMMLKEMKSHLRWEQNEEADLLKPESKKEHDKEIQYYKNQIEKMETIINQLRQFAKSVNVKESTQSDLTESVEMSDDLAAKKIFDKIKGTPGLTRPRIEQYVTKYVGMVGKKASDVKYLTAQVMSLMDDAGLTESFKVGDTVIPKIGPHKGEKHKVIHVFDDGSMNVSPIEARASKIKYKLGAAKAKPGDVEKVSESVDVLVEKSSDETKKIRKLLGPGKTTHERGSIWFSHNIDPKEAKKKLDAAGIKHSHIKTVNGNQVRVDALIEEN